MATDGIRFTDRQLDIMNILWDRGSATVREAKEALEEKSGEDLAYTSVLTLFQTLNSNGHVRYEREGKAYRYYPTVEREEAGESAVDYLLRRIFRRQPQELLASLAGSEEISEEEAERLKAYIDDAAAE